MPRTKKTKNIEETKKEETSVSPNIDAPDYGEYLKKKEEEKEE
jgi:hypothetical protein